MIETPQQYQAVAKWLASLQKVRDSLDHDSNMPKSMRDLYKAQLDEFIEGVMLLLALYLNQIIEKHKVRDV